MIFFGLLCGCTTVKEVQIKKVGIDLEQVGKKAEKTEQEVALALQKEKATQELILRQKEFEAKLAKQILISNLGNALLKSIPVDVSSQEKLNGLIVSPIDENLAEIYGQKEKRDSI